MASVAADPSAIAPPLPPPARSDAAAPAGPSSAFADLLDAAAPAPAPQPQGAATSTAQTGPPAGGGNGSPEPARTGAAAAASGTRTDGASRDTNDPTTVLDPGAAALNVTLVAGLLLPPVPLPASPNADQTPAAAQDPQGASADATPAMGGNGSGKPDDRKDAGAPSDAVPAGLVAALPNLIPLAVAAGVAASSTSDSTSAVASSGVAALQPEAIFYGRSTSALALGTDLTSSSASGPQTNQNDQPVPKPPAAAQDALAAVPSVASALPTEESQTAALLATPQAAAGASDRTGEAAPAAPPTITPAAPTGALTPIPALTPLNAAAPTPPSSDLQLPDQPAGNAASPRESEGIPIPFPAQVAVRFAAPVHADDGNTSDSGPDFLQGFAAPRSGVSTPTSSDGAAGTAAVPNFNPTVPTMASAPPAAPPHTGVMPDAVPLAGIPIAIVARAEAGEKKFEIRLDPPDLGRIEVRLNVDSSGRATSHLIVDRADTLDLLRRDAPALERALQSAGLTTGDGALQFSLRDQSFAGRDQGAPAPATTGIPVPTADTEVAPIDTALRRYGPPMGLGGGVDIRV